jgi:hypothetical protein
MNLYISHPVPWSLKAYLTDHPLVHRDLGEQLLVILAFEHLDLLFPSLSFLIILFSITRRQLIPEGSSSATYLVSHTSLHITRVRLTGLLDNSNSDHIVHINASFGGSNPELDHSDFHTRIELVVGRSGDGAGSDV